MRRNFLARQSWARLLLIGHRELQRQDRLRRPLRRPRADRSRVINAPFVLARADRCPTPSPAYPKFGHMKSLIYVSVPREALTGAKNAKIISTRLHHAFAILARSGYTEVALRDAINDGRRCLGRAIVASASGLGITEDTAITTFFAVRSTTKG